jgi:PAS domain S-box-containing protein
MNDAQVRYHFQLIQQKIEALRQNDPEAWEQIDAALEDLHVIYEQMQTNLETAEVVEEELLKQTEQLAEQYHHYYDLFQASPIPYLITDSSGLILEANTAIATLLNLPQRYLIGKPLILYLAELDRTDFYLKLTQLTRSKAPQIWPFNLRPRGNSPLAVELYVDAIRDASGWIETLWIAVYPIRQSQFPIPPRIEEPASGNHRADETLPTSRLPQSLDGLRVLVVDDEADAREFITAILEPYGIGVRAVSSTDAALEALVQFHPDVIVSDIRLPGDDGYRLIQQIRAIEARQGRHIPAAAITAYVDEDPEKALLAGFEAHLHKLAQPIELVQMVAQLAGRILTPDAD